MRRQTIQRAKPCEIFPAQTSPERDCSTKRVVNARRGSRAARAQPYPLSLLLWGTILKRGPTVHKKAYMVHIMLFLLTIFGPI